MQFTVPTESSPFFMVAERTKRARKLLRDLDQVLAPYIGSSPARLTKREDNVTGEGVITLEGINAVPSECYLLTGEILHHLRSSLDNLAYVIGRQNPGSTFNSERISWPIYKRVSDFELSANKAAVNMFSESDLKQIIACNPTQGDSSALWCLHRLSNIDKHRVPIAAVPSDITPPPWKAIGLIEQQEEVCSVHFMKKPWTFGSIIARVRPSYLNLTFPVNVVIDVPDVNKPAILITLLLDLASLVEKIIEIFVIRHEHPDVTAQFTGFKTNDPAGDLRRATTGIFGTQC